MSPYYFLPIVVAVLNPPSLHWAPLPPNTHYRVTQSPSLTDDKCKKARLGES